MKEKLIDYGFQDWQIEKLLKNKILSTSHGEYEILEGNLYLNKALKSVLSDF